MDVLHRPGFRLGPISIDLIEPKLYLGGYSAATDLDILAKYKITHVLTIDTCPLPTNILELKHLTIKYIQLNDLPNEDLLSYFDDTEAFIRDGLSKGAVLVHCYFGVSRSATVVIAYIMKKYQIHFKEAFEKVKAKRMMVNPNKGFISQLILYEERGYTIDRNNMKYKTFRLNIAADKVRKVKYLSEDFTDLIQFDPGLTRTQLESNVFQCKKCCRVLASESNIIKHNKGDNSCTKTHFVEPLAWMNVTQSTQGKLFCPKCSGEVGSFNWLGGYRCPDCEVKVAPAFYLMPSQIVFINILKKN